MLGVLAEQLVPGSSAAGVVDLLDRVMAVEPAEDQRRFLSALGAFDREARDRYSVGFLEIEDPSSTRFFAAASTAAPARPTPPAWTKGQRITREPRRAAAGELAGSFRSSASSRRARLLRDRARHEGARLRRPHGLAESSRDALTRATTTVEPQLRLLRASSADLSAGLSPK